jgi:hypothetical protein
MDSEPAVLVLRIASVSPITWVTDFVARISSVPLQKNARMTRIAVEGAFVPLTLAARHLPKISQVSALLASV